MALPLAKKLALIAGTSVMVTAVAVGFVSGNSLEQELATRLRRETSDTARGLASRVRNELHGVSHPARLLAQAALERSGDPSVQLAFLKERFSGQKDLIAFSLHHRLDASWGWTPVFRVSRPGAPVQLSQQDFRNLDLRHPLDLSVLEKGGLAVSAGLLAGELPILRIAIPLPKKSDSVITHALTLELSQERLNSVLAEASAVSSLLLDEDRRVLAQTRAWGLSPGERLAEDPRQRLQGPEHFSGFEPVGLSGLWVVTHTTRAPIVRALWNWAGKVSWSALACLLAALALASALGGPSETAAPRERRAPTPEPERETLEAGAPDAPKLPARGIIVASRLIGSGTPSEALRAYDAAAAAAVQAHQGIVHRTGESSLIAVWDAAGERASVEHALEFSLALREAAKRFNDEVETRGDCPGALSVCVHAGDCTDESFELTARIASFGPEVSADILVTGPALTKAPRWFTTEKLSPGDDGTPELHELLGRAKQAPDSAAAA